MHDIETKAVDSPSEYVADQAREYLDSDGATVDHPHADRLILLYVRGRKSGQIRRVPLVSVRDGDDLLIVGSKGGAPNHPAWYLNLAADPRVWVRDRADFYAAAAETLEGEERAIAWSKLVAAMPFFGDYEKKTNRVMPVIRLTRGEHTETVS
ncbi:MAG: nitroreductase family deazaflavin-dependent oxidoreductase [Acidimicrobiia bacterium]|nr:nitroreductase family deazaflavin-dependent oxidoreductase [Acidimicrobiia bacterium]